MQRFLRGLQLEFPESRERKEQPVRHAAKTTKAITLVECPGTLILGIDHKRVDGDAVACAHNSADCVHQQPFPQPEAMMPAVNRKSPDNGCRDRIMRKPFRKFGRKPFPFDACCVQAVVACDNFGRISGCHKNP